MNSERKVAETIRSRNDDRVPRTPEVTAMVQGLRERVSARSPYEPCIGICRAVRAENFVAGAGTAPLGPDGKTMAIGNPAAQARRCLEIIRDALVQLGASLSDVIRTRILLTRMEDWERWRASMANSSERSDL